MVSEPPILGGPTINLFLFLLCFVESLSSFVAPIDLRIVSNYLPCSFHQQIIVNGVQLLLIEN